MILLTRDEVAKAVKVARSSSIYPPYTYPSDKALLEAQLKKVNDFHNKYGMWALKQALLKEVE